MSTVMKSGRRQDGTFDGLGRASQLIERMLRSCDEAIGDVAVEFQRLAAESDRLMEITAEIVDCVEKDCARSILPLVHSLSVAAKTFIEERIETVSRVTDMFTAEAKMLDKLAGATQGQLAIARQVKTLGVLTNIEIAHLGKTGDGLEYMARELDEFSAAIVSGTEKVRSRTHCRAVAKRRGGRTRSLERTTDHLRGLGKNLAEAMNTFGEAVEELSHIPGRFRLSVADVAEKISRIVAAVQSQDVTRQQVEHVRDALETLRQNSLGTEPGSSSELNAALLRVQVFQLKSAHNSMNQWITEIDACLEGISRVGSSEVAGIGRRIQREKDSLSEQLERVEVLRRDSEADDREIDRCLEALNDLMQLVRSHLENSNRVRDRMQLLNFNSMIEANRLGGLAAAVLEIARNTSRISVEWKDITIHSGIALEEMLHTLTRFEENTQAAARDSRQSLDQALKENAAGLEMLKQSGRVATQRGNQINDGVKRMHDEIVFLGTAAERLKVTMSFLSGALDELGLVTHEWGEYNLGVRPGFDRDQFERTCLAGYTTDVERQALRAALDGEASSVNINLGGNEVELF